MAGRGGDNPYQEQSVPGTKEDLFKNVHTSSNIVVVSNGGIVTHTNPGTTAAMQHSNTASSLSPQFNTFTHPLPVNNTSDFWQSPTECINGPIYSNSLLSFQECGPAEPISKIRTKEELAQKQLEEAYQQRFTPLTFYNIAGDILDLGSSYDQELPTPMPQLTSNQSSIDTSQAGLTSIAVTAGNCSSSMTNAIPIVTGHTGQQSSKEGEELLTLSSNSDPKFGPNHAEDDDTWDLNHGVSEGRADMSPGRYLNSPRSVMLLDQNRLHQQEISAMIGENSPTAASGGLQDVAQKQLEDAYQQYFTLPSYSNPGDILNSSYDQELPTPTPQLTSNQSSIDTFVISNNYSSSATNAIPVMTGHTEQQSSKEGVDLVAILSSNSDPKFGPNHAEDDDAWDLNHGVSEGKADMSPHTYLNPPWLVMLLDQDPPQKIGEYNVTHLSGSDLLDHVSYSDHDTEIGRASIGGSHGNISSTSTLPELPSALVQSSSSQTRPDDTAVSSLSGGNTFHSTENHQPKSQGGERFCHYPVSAQPGQVHREALSQCHSKPSSAIEDSLEMIKIMKKGSQSVHGQNFQDSRRDGASSQPLPPEDAGRQNKAIESTVTPNIHVPAVSLVNTSNATVHVIRDTTDHSQFSALPPSKSTQGLCMIMFQTQNYVSPKELITGITVRRDTSDLLQNFACEIKQRISRRYQEFKECLLNCRGIAINMCARLSEIDFDSEGMGIHIPTQCVELAMWLERDPPILDRQHVVQQIIVLLAIFHLGMLSLWGAFKVYVDYCNNQAYVKIEILEMLNKMLQVHGIQHDPQIDDVVALRQLLTTAIYPVFSGQHTHIMLSQELSSRILTINELMLDPSTYSFCVAALSRCFGERRFCKLLVEVGEITFSVFCTEQELLSEAVKDIQSIYRTWQLRLVADNSIVTEEVAQADCPVIHLKFVPIPDEHIKT